MVNESFLSVFSQESQPTISWGRLEYKELWSEGDNELKNAIFTRQAVRDENEVLRKIMSSPDDNFLKVLKGCKGLSSLHDVQEVSEFYSSASLRKLGIATSVH